MVLIGLKEKIKHVCKSEKACAERMGWTKQRLNKITQGRKIATVKEVEEIANALGEKAKDIIYFFI